MELAASSACCTTSRRRSSAGRPSEAADRARVLRRFERVRPVPDHDADLHQHAHRGRHRRLGPRGRPHAGRRPTAGRSTSPASSACCATWRRATRTTSGRCKAYFKAYYYGFPWREAAHARRLRRRHRLRRAHPGDRRRATRRCAAATPPSCCSTWIRRSTCTSATCSRRNPCAKPTSASASRTARACSARRELFNNVDGGSNYIYAFVETHASSPGRSSRRPPGSRCR